MKSAAQLLLVTALVSAALAACSRNEEAKPAAAPASAPVAAASAPAASAPTGPIIAPTALAQPTDAQRSSGATLAAQGGNGAAACNSCHGAHGEGNEAGGFPRIAGQSYGYLLHQLASYADGSRKNAVMQPIAAALSADQRVAAAAYFASLNPDGSSTAAAAATPASGATASASAASAPAATTAAAPAKGAGKASASAGSGGRGAQLAAIGDEAKGIQACVNCHGPGGIGSGAFYPYLAGQYAGYLKSALTEWQDGSRVNDPSGQMPVIAKSLSEQDVAAAAAYYAAQALRTVAVDADRMPSVAVAGGAPAVTSGPQATASAAAAPTGVGTSQGAALTGGSQGNAGGATTANTAGGPSSGASGATAPASAASGAR